MSLTASHPNLPEQVRSLIDKVQPAPSKGSSEKDQSGVNEWLSRISKGPVDGDLAAIDKELLPRTYLVSNELTIADVALYGVLHSTMTKLPSATYYTLPALTRWFDHIQNDPAVSQAASSLSFQNVDFDIENAPTVERKVEAPAKKEKKEKKEASSAAGAGTSAPTSSGKEEKTPKEEKKDKKDKKAAKEGAAAGGSTPKPAKGGKAPPAPAEDSIPVPSMIDLRVGHIIDVKKHPDADGLYVEQIDLGEPEGPRTVVSGLVKYVPIEQMQDRWLIAVCNLKPASMRGVKSFAMVLCATSKDGKEGGIEVCEVPEKSRIPGERVYFEGAEFEGKEPLAQLNPKKKIFEAIQPGFLTLDSRECAWKNAETGSIHRIRTKDGVCTAPTLVGASLS